MLRKKELEIGCIYNCSYSQDLIKQKCSIIACGQMTQYSAKELKKKPATLQHNR